MGFLSDITTGLLGDTVGDLFGSGGGGTSSVPQTPGAKKARTKLEEIAFGELPEIPLRQIAAPGELGEERTLARETAKELAAPVDIFSLPEVQGIIESVTRKGNLLANRLGRILQKSGTLTSSPGRDILGRSVSQVQGELATSLAPFATRERERRTNLIPLLEKLGLTEELREQGFTQAEFDAIFRKEEVESQQLQSFRVPLLQSVIGDQPGLILNPREPSIIEQIGPLLQAAAAFV